MVAFRWLQRCSSQLCNWTERLVSSRPVHSRRKARCSVYNCSDAIEALESRVLPTVIATSSASTEVLLRLNSANLAADEQTHEDATDSPLSANEDASFATRYTASAIEYMREVPTQASLHHAEAAHTQPVFDKEVAKQLANYGVTFLEESVAVVMALTDAEVEALLPTKAGIRFSGSPDASCISKSDNHTWDIAQPNAINFPSCDATYPNATYPYNNTETFTTPTGNTVTYNTHKASDGAVTHIEAAIQFRKAAYFSEKALHLALLYQASTNGQSGQYSTEDYARKAAIILLGTAKAYPNYAYHIDLPNQIRFISGDIESLADDARVFTSLQSLRNPYGVARFGSWTFLELSHDLILAYDIIRHSSSILDVADETGVGADSVTSTMEDGFFGDMVDFLLIGQDDTSGQDKFTNMHPYLWSGLVYVAGILSRNDIIHYVAARTEAVLGAYWLSDGTWKEPSASYNEQTQLYFAGRLLPRLRDYLEEVPVESVPSNFARVVAVLAEMGRNAETFLQSVHYPNGDRIPISDTWSGKNFSIAEYDGLKSSSLYPDLGFASLADTSSTDPNEQLMASLTWHPATGHHHEDVLAMTLFANGHEVLSDIGYTHSRYRSWSQATASHNLVVIDEQNQPATKNTRRGEVLYFDVDAANPVKIVSADASEDLGYGETYTRTLVMVQDKYLVDFFEVEGGSNTYDYILHGQADAVGNSENWTFTENGQILSTVPVLLNSESRPDCSAPGYEWDTPHTIPGCAYSLWMKDSNEVMPVAGDVTAQLSSGNADRLLLHIPDADRYRIFQGTNPAIRPIQDSNNAEDESQLDDFARQHVVLRKENTQGASHLFATVMESTDGPAHVRSVSRLADNILAVSTRNNSTDIIFRDVPFPVVLSVAGHSLAVSGKYGFVSLTSDGINDFYIVEGSLQYGDARYANDSRKPYISVVGLPGENSIELSEPLQSTDDLAGFVRVTTGSGTSLGYVVDRWPAASGDAVTLSSRHGLMDAGRTISGFLGETSESPSSAELFRLLRPGAELLQVETMDSLPTLRWNAFDGAESYSLWLNDVTRRVSGLIRKWNWALTEYTLPNALAPGEYSFEVRAERPARGAWTQRVRFTIGESTSPTITAPRESTAFPTLAWSPVSGAGNYDIRITDDRGLEVDAALRLDSTLYTPRLAPGTYHAIVQAHGVSGPVGTASDVHEFTVVSSIPNLKALPETISDATPQFQWQPVPGAVTYEIWVDDRTDGDRKEVWRPFVFETVHAVWTPLQEHDYQWQIKARGANGVRGVWSAVHRFRLNVATPARPIFIEPGEGVLVPTPILRWNPVPGAYRYYVLMKNLDTRQAVIRESAITGESYTSPTAMPAGDYRVWVLAYNEVGEKSEWSEARTFRVVEAAQQLTPQAQAFMIGTAYSRVIDSSNRA